MADIFILIDDGIALAGLDGKGHDLVLELAGLLRRLGLVLAGHGEFVLHLAADLPALRDILGGLAHVIAVEGVPQPVLDHAVDHIQIAHLLPGAQIGHMRRQRHAFLPPRGHDPRIAQLHMLGRQRHRPQPRAADLVQRPGRTFLPEPRLDMRLTRRVLPLPRRQHLAKDGFLNLGLVDTGARHDGFQHRRPKFMGGRRAKDAVETADGRAGRGNDYDIGHEAILCFAAISVDGPDRRAGREIAALQHDQLPT